MGVTVFSTIPNGGGFDTKANYNQNGGRGRGDHRKKFGANHA